MIGFERPGRGNTVRALSCAMEQAIARHLPLVVATNTGETACTLLELYAARGERPNIVAVSHVNGFVRPGEQELEAEFTTRLKEAGIPIVTATHVLSGVERGLSSKFGGVYPAEIMAYTLRTMGQGTKVAVEIAIMALDHGAIVYGQPVVSVGGTGRGADTALILTPAHAAQVLDTRIHEILCKPTLYPNQGAE